MMMKATWALALVVIFGANLCTAQSNGLPATPKWGDSVQGVQLSITMTNSVFGIGTSTTVAAITKNSSSNEITIEISFPTVAFNILLTNDAGKSYRIVTPFLIRGMRQFATLKPGEERIANIPVTFREDIEPGNYTLNASRHFTLNNEEFSLVSNALKVQIQ
jgi:hypothetical protein